MYPVLFKIGNFSVHTWGLLLAIAVIIAIYAIEKVFEREGLDSTDLFYMIALMIIAGILGGRVAYILVYDWAILISNPLSLITITSGGISGLIWYGGVVGGVIPFIYYIRKNNWSFWQIGDIFAPYIALGYAIVRVGCFLNGCCYGAITNSSLGVVFPYVDNFTRYPTQLFSTVLNLLLFVFLIWLFPRRKFTGQVFLYYILGYAVYRFIIEFFRESIIMVGFFTLGQIYTLILLAIGIILYVWRKHTLRRA